MRTASLLFLLVPGRIGGGLPLAAVCIAGGLSAAVSPASYAAVRWSVPRMVRPEQLGRANAVVGLSEQLPLLVGGALVGPTLAWLGPVAGMAVPAAVLLLAFALAARLPTAGATTPAEDPAVTEPGSRGRIPGRVTALLLLSTAYYLAYGPYETAMPGFVRDRLHADPTAYSLLWAAFGLGAVAGVALAPALSRRRAGLVNALGATVWGW